jgi:nuclear migration protein JNM1
VVIINIIYFTDRLKTYYAYPPSPTSPLGDLPGSGSSRPVPLSHRLRALQAELSSLEHEISDPANPLLQKEREEENVDPGELIRGLVDVRGRLDKIRKRKEGRGKLVGVVLEKDTKVSDEEVEEDEKREEGDSKDSEIDSKMRTLVEMDKRVGELEKIIGSSNTALDEVSFCLLLILLYLLNDYFRHLPYRLLCFPS